LDALLQKQKAERSPSWSDILSLSKQVDAWKQLIFLYLHERSRLMGKEKKKKKTRTLEQNRCIAISLNKSDGGIDEATWIRTGKH
jgi:hypothetical protein